MTQGTIVKKSRNHFRAVCIVAVVLLSGCFENKDNVVTSAPASATKSGKLATVAGTTSEHLGLTPAYLTGNWCNTHIQFPNVRSVENIGYRFSPDGTFTAQTTPQSEMKSGFLYDYETEGKVMLGTFPGMLLQVKSVEPDAFVLHVSSNDMHFRRGTCK